MKNSAKKSAKTHNAPQVGAVTRRGFAVASLAVAADKGRKKRFIQPQMTAAGKPQPFHPVHIAALAWLLLPGGVWGDPATSGTAYPTTLNPTYPTDDLSNIPGLVKQINLQYSSSTDQANAKTAFREVYIKLKTYLDQHQDNPAKFKAVSLELLNLLSDMDFLWGGSDSKITGSLVGAILAAEELK